MVVSFPAALIFMHMLMEMEVLMLQTMKKEK